MPYNHVFSTIDILASHELPVSPRLPDLGFIKPHMNRPEPSKTDKSNRSSQSSVNKLLLQLSNLSLESLNLLPTIQRSAIVHPQTLHKTLLGFLNRRIGLLEILAALELAAQFGDFFGYAVVAAVLVLR